MIIAIDGGGGTGKSSTAKGMAKKLKLDYLDTGAMYRALTLFFLESNSSLAEFETGFKISTDPYNQIITLDNREITNQIRSANITDNVSKFASVQKNRDLLIKMQKQIVTKSKNIVLEGRDTTSVIAPNADLKIIITTDLEARAKRREIDGEYIGNLQERDTQDSKVNDFTTSKEGVITVDNTNMNLEETIDYIISLISF